MRAFRPGPRGGTVFVQGTTTTANIVKVLPKLDELGLNVKIVACISPQLFAMQDEAYREATTSLGDRWDGMAVTNRAWQTMRHWIGGPIARDYSLSSDWDDRWRTGGTVEEVIDEANLSADHILAAIERFVAERERRLARLREIAEAAERHS
jgi:transketolase